MACESFKSTYLAVLSKAVEGSRVKTMCHTKTTPVIVAP
jgi:hypothetical protein